MAKGSLSFYIRSRIPVKIVLPSPSKISDIGWLPFKVLTCVRAYEERENGFIYGLSTTHLLYWNGRVQSLFTNS